MNIKFIFSSFCPLMLGNCMFIQHIRTATVPAALSSLFTYVRFSEQSNHTRH